MDNITWSGFIKNIVSGWLTVLGFLYLIGGASISALNVSTFIIVSYVAYSLVFTWFDEIQNDFSNH